MSGRTRAEALARLRRAMAETTVVIEGGATNKSFILDLLAQPEVADGGGTGWADTGWIDRVRGEGRLHSHRHSGVALVAAAIHAYEDEERLVRDRHDLHQPLGPLAQARQAGAGVEEAEDKPWGDRVAVITDPDGYRWALATFKKLAPFEQAPQGPEPEAQE